MQDIPGGKGRLEGQGFCKMKKEEFPGTMWNMPAGNSFPQICVVSVPILWKLGSDAKSTKGHCILVTCSAHLW
jgi:hypothetical protein